MSAPLPKRAYPAPESGTAGSRAPAASQPVLRLLVWVPAAALACRLLLRLVCNSRHSSKDQAGLGNYRLVAHLLESRPAEKIYPKIGR